MPASCYRLHCSSVINIRQRLVECKLPCPSIHLVYVEENLLCKFMSELVDAGFEPALLKQIDDMFSSPAYDNINQQLVTALPETSIVGTSPRSHIHSQILACYA